MPRARDLLARFRPVGTPGAAGPAGVPADRLAELGRELQPVFEALAPTEAEAHRIRDEGRAEAERRREQGAQRARAILDDARRDTEAQRAAAATRVLQEVREETAAALTVAEHEAAAVAERAADRYDGYVARVVETVRPVGARR